MTKPKLSSKTPDDPILNSLIDSHDDLLRRPAERRFAVVELIVTDRTFPTHGDDYARVQVVHLEEIIGADLDTVLKLRDHRFTERTGQKSPPDPDTPLDIDSLDDEADGV
jgi:hypothetical protein